MSNQIYTLTVHTKSIENILHQEMHLYKAQDIS